MSICESDFKLLGGVAEAVQTQAHAIGERHQQARELAIAGGMEINRAPRLERAAELAAQQQRHLLGVVEGPLLVCQDDAAIVEDSAIPFARRFEPGEQVSELLDPEAADRREGPAVAIVREAVMVVTQAEER